MSYDEGLAARVRRILADRTDVVERKMFGGLCFMVNGAMCCGLTKTDFMVRIGPANYDAALREPHARRMDFTGRPLAGMVYVAPEGLRKDSTLTKWVDRAVKFVVQRDGANVALRAKKPGKGTKAAVGGTTKASAAHERTDPRVSKLLAALKADRELVAIVDAFLANRSAGSARKFGSNGLKVNGKLFALFTQETLVVKLSRARVLDLVSAGTGQPFDPGHGRLMKEWLTVTSHKASWLALAREAYEFVSR
jgi:TfoX/Sxy family transcriptional regulator of competence genes